MYRRAVKPRYSEPCLWQFLFYSKHKWSANYSLLCSPCYFTHLYLLVLNRLSFLFFKCFFITLNNFNIIYLYTFKHTWASRHLVFKSVLNAMPNIREFNCLLFQSLQIPFFHVEFHYGQLNLHLNLRRILQIAIQFSAVTKLSSILYYREKNMLFYVVE